MQKRGEIGERMFESRNSFGGFGSQRSMLSNIFGGRDSFDDPFFTRPFDSISGPSSSAHRNTLNMKEDKGVIIKELNSDDEGDINYPPNGDEEKKHSRSTMEPSVEHPDDDDGDEERKLKQLTRWNDYDKVVLEESKEADKTTGQATHRISRGIHDKGHSFTRRLNSDGKIDTMQTLHNLNEDELSGFEEKWKGNNNAGHVPGSKGGHGMHWNQSSGNGGPTESRMWRNWLCPSLEEGGSSRGFVSRNEATSTGGRTKKVVRINIE